MKIILDIADVKKLIEKEYSGVKSINFTDKDFSITLEMDDVSFVKNKQLNPPEQIAAIPPKPKTAEEKAQAAVKAKAMVSGGRNRAMIRM